MAVREEYSLAPLPALTGKQLLGGRRWDEREGAMVEGGGKGGGRSAHARTQMKEPFFFKVQKSHPMSESRAALHNNNNNNNKVCFLLSHLAV